MSQETWPRPVTPEEPPDPPADPPAATEAASGAGYTPTAPSEAFDELVGEGEPGDTEGIGPEEVGLRPAEVTEAADAPPDPAPPADAEPTSEPLEEAPPPHFVGELRCHRCHVAAPTSCTLDVAEAAGWKVHARQEPETPVILCPGCTRNHAVITAAQKRHAANPFA